MHKKSNDFWGAYIFFQVVALFVFDFDIYYQAAIAIFNYQFLSFFFNLGNGLIIRYLIGTIYSLNYLLGPVLMYTWLNPFVEVQYTLKGDYVDYFTYVIPAMLAMLAGLHMFAGKNDSFIDLKRLKAIIDRWPRLPMQMIVVGLATKLVSPLIPDQFDLLTTAIANIRYVGFFLHVLFAKRINYIYLGLTYGLLMLEAVLSSMFNDLLNLLFFLSVILAVRFKPNTVMKIGAVAAGIAIIVFIQIIKMPLRAVVAEKDIEIEQIDGLIGEGLETNVGETFDHKVANIIFRTTQGWVTSNVINYYYNYHGFQLQGGSHIWIMIKSSVLPRILVPDKYQVGDRELFNSYAGHTISLGTSIALGIVADAFIDFGMYGFVITFFWGLLFSMAVRFYAKWDIKHPLIKLLSVVCWFYAIRADTDTHSSLGALIKITAVVWVISLWFDKYFFKYMNKKLVRRPAF